MIERLAAAIGATGLGPGGAPDPVRIAEALWLADVIRTAPDATGRPPDAEPGPQAGPSSPRRHDEPPGPADDGPEPSADARDGGGPGDGPGPATVPAEVTARLHRAG